jgi:hypothetical protein
MNERVRPDYSVRMGIEGTDDGYLLDPRYDFIRVFPWLGTGYGIVNVVTEDGIHRMYTTEEQCRNIHETAGIPLVELEWIVESEHENMIDIMARDLESWLE